MIDDQRMNNQLALFDNQESWCSTNDYRRSHGGAVQPAADVLLVLHEAAAGRTSVRFHYVHGYKHPGCRFVEIHTVALRRPRRGRPYYYVTGIQWAGATEGRKPLPGWRTFYAHHIVRIARCDPVPDGVARAATHNEHRNH